jgi:hypothetical protein
MCSTDPSYDHKVVYHYAAKILYDGSVSALCYKLEHGINLTKRQSWVLEASRVTCPRCRKVLRELSVRSLRPDYPASMVGSSPAIPGCELSLEPHEPGPVHKTEPHDPVR